MNDFYPPRGPPNEPRHTDAENPTSPPEDLISPDSASAALPDRTSYDASSPLPSAPPPPAQANPDGPPQFPSLPADGSARVWFMTTADNPVATSCAIKLVARGDCIIAGINRRASAPPSCAECRAQLQGLADTTASETPSSLGNDSDGEGASSRGRGRCVLVDIETSSLASVQAALARGIAAFGHISILYLSTSVTLLGTVEELAQSPVTHSLLNSTFQVNFFSAINCIKAVLPHMRGRGMGHIVLLTGITGHLGTPGLGAYCASQWAIEGYADSLAFEVAPFGVRVSIVQANAEVGILTGRVIAVPAMPDYGVGSWKDRSVSENAVSNERDGEGNRAPLARGWLSSIIGRLETASQPGEETEAQMRSAGADMLSPGMIADFYPRLPHQVKDELIAETVYAILSISGHENPPARHIVGHEGVASVKEKLKTVSEELEDFVAVSGSVDL